MTYALWVFVGNALFPRLAYWLRWPTRARGRLLLAYIAWNAALLFWLRQSFLPALADAFGKAAPGVQLAGFDAPCAANRGWSSPPSPFTYQPD